MMVLPLMTISPIVWPSRGTGFRVSGSMTSRYSSLSARNEVVVGLGLGLRAFRALELWVQGRSWALKAVCVVLST